MSPQSEHKPAKIDPVRRRHAERDLRRMEREIEPFAKERHIRRPAAPQQWRETAVKARLSQTRRTDKSN